MPDEASPNPAPNPLPTDSADAAPPSPQDTVTSQNTVPARDTVPPDVLKSAYNAFKKRWKLTNLDQVSQIGRGPMSSGQKSSITGITPPDQFPTKVWNELVKQGRLKYVGSGCYAMK